MRLAPEWKNMNMERIIMSMTTMMMKRRRITSVSQMRVIMASTVNIVDMTGITNTMKNMVVSGENLQTITLSILIDQNNTTTFIIGKIITNHQNIMSLT